MRDASMSTPGVRPFPPWPGERAPPPVLTVRLLGGFSAEDAAGPVPGLGAPRLQSLLAWLLLHRGERRSRQQLAFLLWPESSDAQAQTNLRTALHRLRRALPDPERFLTMDPRKLLWRGDAPCRLDVAEFEAASADDSALPALRRALELYRSDLLPDACEPWVERERERLRRRFAAAAERACRLLEAGRDYAGAVELAARLAAHDPFDEENHRRLMRLHALAGQRGEALRAYRVCVELLARELEVEPEPATRALYEHLIAGTSAGGEARARRPEARATTLIGRFPELDALQDAWRSALAGRARVIVIGGEPGIGKTRLAAELADWVGGQGFAVAWGRAYPVQGELAYAPIVPWVRAGLAAARSSGLGPVWLAELARVLPELRERHPDLPAARPISEPGEREHFAEALARATLASTPTLLVLDDLQWCSAEALAWLHYVLRSNPTSPVLVAATLRPAEIDPALASLLPLLERDGQLARVELRPLADAESARLATAIAGPDVAAPPPGVYLPAGGNPLFIVELVRFHAGRTAESRTDSALPPTIRGVIAARLAQLSEPTRGLAGSAAVIGQRISERVLAEIADLPASRLARSLDELRARGILLEGDDGHLEFAHELIRRHAYYALGPALRRHLHARVAAALGAAFPRPQPSSSEIAVHYERAGRPGPACRHYRDAAAASARTGASEEAIRLLRRALTLADAPEAAKTEPPAVALEIQERLADLLYLTGRYADSRLVIEEAFGRTGDALWQARFFRRLGKAAIGERDYAGALAALETAERLLEGVPHSPASRGEWLQANLDRMSVLYWLGDWQAMEAIHLRIAPTLERYGSTHHRRQDAWHLISTRLRRDRYIVTDEMVALCRQNLSSTIEDGGGAAVAVATFHHAFALLWHGTLEEARTEAEHALRLAAQTGDRSLELRCLTYLAVIGRVRRDANAVHHYAARSLEAATTLGHRDYRGAAQANQAWLAWRDRDRAAATSLARAAVAAWEQSPDESGSFMFEWLGRLVLIALALERRGPAPLEDAVRQARRLLEPSQQRLADGVNAALEEGIRKWDSGDAPAARRQLRDMLELARQERLL